MFAGNKLLKLLIEKMKDKKQLKHEKYMDEDWPVDPMVYMKECDGQHDSVVSKIDNDITWGQLFEMFTQRNIVSDVDDYRISNESYKFQIWLKDGSTKYVKYHRDRDEFELSEVTDGGYLKWDRGND